LVGGWPPAAADIDKKCVGSQGRGLEPGFLKSILYKFLKSLIFKKNNQI
jgi:hypothetical protein